VNERSLRAYCARHIGMSPKHYQELRRMQIVREQLRAADPARTTVAAIATRRGIRHLGRFSVRYRELFGESPSATLSTYRQGDLRPGTNLTIQEPRSKRTGCLHRQAEHLG
jgi:methylphosphotriester-DNA--protein-cysteine methyltransferase